MLIVALVMAVIGLAALVAAVVTSNQLIAWVCIGASVIGVVLLIVDALRERRQRDVQPAEGGERDEAAEEESYDADYPEEQQAEEEPADESEAAQEEPSEPEANR